VFFNMHLFIHYLYKHFRYLNAQKYLYKKAFVYTRTHATLKYN